MIYIIKIIILFNIYMVKLVSSYINFTIANYIMEPIKTLKKWVKPYVKEIGFLSNFEYIYCRNSDKIANSVISKSNTLITKIILQNVPHKINWYKLSQNSSHWAYRLLKNNPNKIFYNSLSRNPSNWAYKLLKKNGTEIHYDDISRNPSLWAKKIFMNRPDKTEFYSLSQNPSKWAYKLLNNNVNLYGLSQNIGDWACELLKKNPEKIYWWYLSLNPSKWAYKFLKNNPCMINWFVFLLNPNIFKPMKHKTKQYYKLFDQLLHKKN